MSKEIKFKCKIDSHIPKEDGLNCECGYFIKKDSCVKLLIEGYEKEAEEHKVGGSLDIFKKLAEERINNCDKKSEQCYCQSYFDNNNKLQDCTCGKCF